MKKFIFIFLLFFNISIVGASSKFKVTLDSCIDGDTARFNIKGEVRTVRFLSIDSPEIKHDDIEAQPFGDEAKVFTCNALSKASSIKLQYDSKSDIEDKYGRVLAWVFVDNDLLQEKLVSEGLAQVKYVYDDYLYSSKLKSLEKIAKEDHVGIWNITDDDFQIDDSDNDFDVFIYICFLYLFVLFIIFKFYFKKKK